MCRIKNAKYVGLELPNISDWNTIIYVVKFMNYKTTCQGRLRKQLISIELKFELYIYSMLTNTWRVILTL